MFIQTCPNCGSSDIITDGRVTLNTMEFVSFVYDVTYDTCRSCGAEAIDTVEVETPDDNGPSMINTLKTMSAYLLEIHEEDNGMFVSAHDGEAKEQGPYVEGCSYCKVIYNAKTLIYGKIFADRWVTDRKAEYGNA